MKASKDHLWDGEGQTVSEDPLQGPKITDISQPIFRPPHPDLIEYPKYIRLEEGQPKVRVSSKEHEDALRANSKPTKAKKG